MRVLVDLHNLPEGSKLAVSYLRVSTSAQADRDYSSEGFSLPAQREANQRAADRLGAVIVAEFVDRGESARSVDRPDLQAMLHFLREVGYISYAIVHKVDRLARSREDDVVINLAIRQAGAQLISATENIDETPSGKLLHGIMATIAEFYSSNLAVEVKKGMTQKARIGGTTGRAPIGYQNVRVQTDGKEIRTVIVDPERAPLITWMFEAYASGDWTMRQLEAELACRGLRIPATAKQPARKVSLQHVDRILRNRYYIGFVRFQGVEYEGRHPALIDHATFERVQAIRISRRDSREKMNQHPNYLKGSVFCGLCGSRLGVTNARNRWGTVYPYFYCLNRQKARSCTFRATLIADVDAAVTTWWRSVNLSKRQISEIRSHVARILATDHARNRGELDRQHLRVKHLENQRHKLLEARYADAIPLDLFKAEQERITKELEGTQQAISHALVKTSSVLEAVEEVLLLCAHAYGLYLSAPDTIRRQLNQAVVAKFWISEGEVGSTGLTSTFAQILEPQSQGAMNRRNPDSEDQNRGSNTHTRVDLTGPRLNSALVRYIENYADLHNL